MVGLRCEAVREAAAAGLMTGRMRIYFECGGNCHWCGRHMTLGKQTLPTAFTIEHIVPLAVGGNSVPSNLTGACKRCNNLRGTLASSFFHHLVATFGPHMPEHGTPRYQRLHNAIAQVMNGRRTRVRVPGWEAAHV